MSVSEAMPGLLMAAEFEPHIGATYRTANTEPQVDLALSELRKLKVFPGPGRQDPFALLFVGPVDKALPQATFRLVGPGSAEYDIFLVPVGLRPEGRLYEAVFN